MAAGFALIFLTVVATSLVIRLWLANRHVAFVQAHRGEVPPLFAERIPLAAHRKAADYTAMRTRLGMQAALAETALLLILTLGGGLQSLHEFWNARLDGIAYGVVLIVSVMVISGLVDLPFSLFRQFVVEERFGFNRMTIGLFFSDLAKQLVIGALLGIPLIAAVLWLMAAMGSLWWLWVWLFWSGFNLLLLFIYPTWIAPLFNKFSPLAEGEMKSRIEALLARCGFQSRGLFVMDGSRRSNHGNAYFTGFGRAKRIVFFDTLLARLQPAEIEAVLAHELGHFRHRHVLKRIVMMFALSLGGLWLLGQLTDAAWFYEGLGVSARNTALALILFFLAGPVFAFPFGPLMSLLSRRHEFEADAYAARHAGADDLIHALIKLYEDNASTLTPDPLHSLVYDSHPPAAQRIDHLRQLQTR